MTCDSALRELPLRSRKGVRSPPQVRPAPSITLAQKAGRGGTVSEEKCCGLCPPRSGPPRAQSLRGLGPFSSTLASKADRRGGRGGAESGPGASSLLP